MAKLHSTQHYNPHDPEDVPRVDEPDGGYDPLPPDFEPIDLPNDFLPSFEAPEAPSDPPIEDSPASFQQTNPPPKLRRRVTRHSNRAETYGRAITSFEARRDEERANGISPYRNFESDEVFEMVEWIFNSGVSQKEGTRLLKTKMVSRSIPTFARVLIQFAPASARESSMERYIYPYTRS
jgi:hypothetical protein